jgi:OFA family oxalate/formate antiporter-like MFS transporter
MSIGSTYAYSVFKIPLSDKWGWDGTEVSLAFTIAIFFLGMSAALFGKFVERYGPRISGMTAALCFSAGLVCTGVAVHYGSLIGFYLSYGVLGGIGLGIGYISPVSTLVKWFPDRRGLATGMAVMGFGAGSLVCSPIAARLIEELGVSATFFILGTAYFILMMSGALYIARPPEGWLPASMRNRTADQAADDRIIKRDLAQLTANEAVRTARFWMLWVMMFVNISAGIMLISVASPMAQEKVGMTAAAAATMVGIMGLFNGGGRIGWAFVSDYIGRTRIFTLFFCVQTAAFLLLPNVTNALIFQLLIFLILSMYGGGFASLPAFIGDLFGTKQLGAIHGYLLTSWSMAGIAGPMIVAYLYEVTNTYDAVFYIFAGMLAAAFIVSLLIRRNIRKVRAANAANAARSEMPA